MNRKDDHKSHIEEKPHPIPLFRVGNEMAFTKDWEPVQVKEHNGWRYIQAGGKVRLRSLPDKTGATEPVYFNYVFGGGFMQGKNEYYDALLAIR